MDLPRWDRIGCKGDMAQERYGEGILPAATAKRGQMLPLIQQGFLEKLLPQQWGLQGLLRLSYAVDLLLDAKSTERTGRDRI